MSPDAVIDRVEVEVYEVPTDEPEADGTLSWASTTVIVVKLIAGDCSGLGFTYAGKACKAVIEDQLGPAIKSCSAIDVAARHRSMLRACRNLGRPGVVGDAISAVDIACWDLKARLCGLSLSDLLGQVLDGVPLYGSGGFTTYSDTRTTEQLEHWVDRLNLASVKIKVGESFGADEARDLHRVRLARRVIGEGVELFVDANGGYSAKQAIRLGRAMSHDSGVVWLEEPVSSDDLAGLRLVRECCDADVAAGEYGDSPWYFEQMLAARAVDCLQADVTRCGGITGWLGAAQLCDAHQLQISGHCAPSLHVQVAAAVANTRHLEYFHDHVRIESMLFDGVLMPSNGMLVPDRSVPGHGLSLRESDAARFRVG